MLELYHHGSSVCAAKVRLALAEKALPWTGHYLDLLKGEQFSPAFLRINPKAMVPALVHDGRIVIESTVICEYLEQVFPARPIYPADAYDRAQVRIWTKAVDEDLHPACSALTYTVSHRHTVLKNVQKFEDFLNAPSNESVETLRLGEARALGVVALLVARGRLVDHVAGGDADAVEGQVPGEEPVVADLVDGIAGQTLRELPALLLQQQVHQALRP